MSPDLVKSLAVIMTAMVLNQVVVRSERMLESRPIYLSMQTINLVSIGLIVAFGLPGFEGARMYSLAIAAVFFMRVVITHYERQKVISQAGRDELEGQADALRAKAEGDENDEPS